jgi:hypothetical protein
MILLALLITYFSIPHLWSSIWLYFDPNIAKKNQFPPMPSQITYGWPNFSSKISFFLHFPQIPFLCSKFFNLKEHVLLYHKKEEKILEHSIILGDGNTTGLTILDLERSTASVVD